MPIVVYAPHGRAEPEEHEQIIGVRHRQRHHRHVTREGYVEYQPSHDEHESQGRQDGRRASLPPNVAPTS